MHERSNTLHTWIQSFCGAQTFKLQPLAGDASFRRYFRLYTNDATYVVMDSPLHQEPIDTWIEINIVLEQHGLRTPKILAQERTQGFLVLDDLGDNSMMSAISDQHTDCLYRQAMDSLLNMQKISTANINLPIFDAKWALSEMQIMEEWFLKNLLSLHLSIDQHEVINRSFQLLARKIATQPTTFIHRDYHSRNIMVLENSELGLIDFQDAMIGPITYDLVSLLKDCYLMWPPAKRKQWLTYFYLNLDNEYNISIEEFEQAFELCGLQRHLKVLGVFSRLHLRDKKSAYLKDLPRTFEYVISCLAEKQELQELYTLMTSVIQPRFIKIMDKL